MWFRTICTCVTSAFLWVQSRLMYILCCVCICIRYWQSLNIPHFHCWNALKIWQHLKESRFIAMLFIMLKYLFGKQYHPVDVTEPTFFVNKYLSKVGHGNFYSQDMIVAAKIWQFWSHSSQNLRRETPTILNSVFLLVGSNYKLKKRFCFLPICPWTSISKVMVFVVYFVLSVRYHCGRFNEKFWPMAWISIA